MKAEAHFFVSNYWVKISISASKMDAFYNDEKYAPLAAFFSDDQSVFEFAVANMITQLQKIS
jgi:hypothetical protein